MECAKYTPALASPRAEDSPFSCGVSLSLSLPEKLILYRALPLLGHRCGRVTFRGKAFHHSLVVVVTCKGMLPFMREKKSKEKSSERSLQLNEITVSPSPVMVSPFPGLSRFDHAGMYLPTVRCGAVTWVIPNSQLPLPLPTSR